MTFAPLACLSRFRASSIPCGSEIDITIAEALQLPSAALSQHVIILGKTRAGKFSMMRPLVDDLVGAGKPVCVIDPKGDWSSIAGRKFLIGERVTETDVRTFFTLVRFGNASTACSSATASASPAT
jgi:hypothetical protein